jgi:glycerol-3-phosphate dehydrogenase
MRLTVEERVFILESYLKTMSYAQCKQSFFEKFRRQAPLKSAVAKMIKNERTIRKVVRNMMKRVDKCIEINGHHFQHLL